MLTHLNYSCLFGYLLQGTMSENQFLEFVFSLRFGFADFFFYQFFFERKTDATKPPSRENHQSDTRKNRILNWTEMGCLTITVGLTRLRDWDRHPTLTVRCPTLITATIVNEFTRNKLELKMKLLWCIVDSKEIIKEN